MRAPRHGGLLLAFGCVAVALVIALLEAMDQVDRRLASSAVIFLAVLGGMILSDLIPEIRELRLDRDGFVVRWPLGKRRYRWRDIPMRFQVVPGERGPRISFVWCSRSSVERVFLHPATLGLPASRIATLMNERWERARGRYVEEAPN